MTGRPTTAPPVALTIAGSDPSGGAGIQADLKTFSALGAYGTSVLAALTAQSTLGVTGVHQVPAGFITEQLETLIADVPIDAVKIGMLGGAEAVRAVDAFLAAHPELPVVLDPVMVSTAGSRLLRSDAEQAMHDLIPRADLITPNLGEAAVLLGCDPATDTEAMERQAEALLSSGARRVLLKGGHLSGEVSPDLLSGHEGQEWTQQPRIETPNAHGTGCTLSAAIAALYPRSRDWGTAVRDARDYLTAALRQADGLHIGEGAGPVHHFHAWWPVEG